MKDEEIITKNNSGYEDESIDWRSLFLKCYFQWPWFAASIIICLVCAWFYLHYATPIYKVSASVLIKEEDKNSNRNNGLADLTQIGIFSSTKNFDNEIEILHSKSLIKSVIEELNLNSVYFINPGLKKTESYKSCPFEVYLPPVSAEHLTSPAKFIARYTSNGSLEVNATIDGNTYERTFNSSPALLPTHVGTFCFRKTNNNTMIPSKRIIVIVYNPIKLAGSYVSRLSVSPSSKTTTIALLTFKDSQKDRAADFINRLVDVYNNNTNNDKNAIALKTSEFIDKRIDIISKDLFNTEKDLENFKRQAGLTDVKSDAELALQQTSEYNKLQNQNTTQLNIIKYLNNAISNKKLSVLPTQIGLQDQNLSSQIENYNKLVIDRNRLSRNSSDKNPAIQELDLTINSSRDAIRSTLHSIEQGLSITQKDLSKQSGKFSSRIVQAPTQERKYVSISRQQEIKSQLYLMLLQKREENSIELASTANNAKIIDAALADDTPISPRHSIIYLVALILGFAFPIGGIYIRDLLKFRIEGHTDVEKLTKAPIIGDVPLAPNTPGKFVVHKNKNDIMMETFREIRTNLKFMIKDEHKVIMVTSSISGEGKTFIATNLAISLALLDKKIIIVGLDIRKPGLNKVFDISHSEVGLTQFLAHPSTTNLTSLIRNSNVIDGLDLLPSGVVPPNPTELLDSPALRQAIDILKTKYDYIILDTAPIGLVSDTQLIGNVSDLTIYVCRADYTPKAEYVLIEELRKKKRLPNICTIINAIDMKKRKYGYYGYGKYYYTRKDYGYHEYPVAKSNNNKFKH
jgi:tyrosine-protein kinase Etk/Wzc